MTEKVSFGNKNQPFYELSPTYKSKFVMYNRTWDSLLQFWVVHTFEDYDIQRKLLDIRGSNKMLSYAKKCGFIDLGSIDKELFLESIHEAFVQDKERGFILMSTGSAELIYNSSKSYLTENNRYGRILMKMRHIIAEELK